jgi:hypothetical protein
MEEYVKINNNLQELMPAGNNKKIKGMILKFLLI